MMKYLFAVAIIMAAYPTAAQPAPGLDEAGCLALAAKMDEGEAGKRKVTTKERTAYDDCVVHYNCYKVSASSAPPGTYDTSVTRMRYMIQMCGGSETRKLRLKGE